MVLLPLACNEHVVTLYSLSFLRGERHWYSRYFLFAPLGDEMKLAMLLVKHE